MQDETAEAMRIVYYRGSGCFNSNVVCSAIEPAAGGTKIGSVSGTAGNDNSACDVGAACEIDWSVKAMAESALCSFFFQCTLLRPFINAGADGAFGTAGDLFAPTNETVAQIRDRVLPPGATISGVTITDDNSLSPLYTKTTGFASLNLRGGVAVAENLSLNLALMNIRRRTGKVKFGKDREFATLPFKAGELTRGDYLLILFGQTADGRNEEIYRYFFRVLYKTLTRQAL